MVKSLGGKNGQRTRFQGIKDQKKRGYSRGGNSGFYAGVYIKVSRRGGGGKKTRVARKLLPFTRSPRNQVIQKKQELRGGPG